MYYGGVSDHGRGVVGNPPVLGSAYQEKVVALDFAIATALKIPPSGVIVHHDIAGELNSFAFHDLRDELFPRRVFADVRIAKGVDKRIRAVVFLELANHLFWV